MKNNAQLNMKLPEKLKIQFQIWCLENEETASAVIRTYIEGLVNEQPLREL